LPKIFDPTTSGLSYELPSIWAGWLEEVAVPGSGKLLVVAQNDSIR